MSEIEDALRELQSIDHRLNSEPLVRVRHRLLALKQTYRVFEGNWAELHAALAQLDDPEVALPILDVRTPERVDAFLDEVDRLLHNFVASAASLIDHTRRHVRSEYPEGSQVRQQYDLGVKTRFAFWGPGAFVKDLRNFTLHRKLPLSVVRLSWERDRGLDVGVILPTEPLLDWDRWRTESRQYLRHAPTGGIRLDEVVQQYGERVAEFYEWFGAFQVIHDLEGVRELDRLIERRDQLAQKLSKVFNPPGPPQEPG